MLPAMPLSACCFAADTSSGDRKALNSSAMIATINGAPTNSANHELPPHEDDKNNRQLGNQVRRGELERHRKR